MPIIRNPFRKQDENARPTIVTTGVDKANGTGARPIDAQSKDSAEYKLSEINDSGICLPPSPPVERQSFWGHTNSSRSTTGSTYRSMIKENEPFNISRESFDSYRRSFDISGRSPVIGPLENGGRPRASLDSRSFQTLPPRTSLDSRTFQPPPRTSNLGTRPAPVPVPIPNVAQTKEEDFEDVGLDDKPTVQPKKRSLFARLTDSNTENAPSADARPVSPHERSWHHFGSGRKRGQSGQGAELGSIPKREETPRPESALRRSETPKPLESVQAPNAD